MPDFDWERPLKDLHELAELTGGPDGARRLAWSEDWRGAREWLLGKLGRDRRDRRARRRREPVGDDPGRERQDRRRRLAHRRGAARRLARRLPRRCCAAVEVLRAHKGETPAVTLKLIDWADEEGARFGRSLLGSSAAAGHARSRRGPPPQGQPGHRAAGRAGGERHRPRHDGRGRAARDRRLPRAAHRAGPAPGGDGQAGRGRDRLLRRRASRDHVHRQGQPRRQHADEPAPRRVPGRGALRPRGARIGEDARRRRHDRHRHRRARASRRSSTSAARSRSTSAPSSPSSCATCWPTSRRPPSRSPHEEGVEVEWTRIWQIDPIPFDDTLVEPRRAGGGRDHRRRRPAAAALRRPARLPPRSPAAIRP